MEHSKFIIKKYSSENSDLWDDFVENHSKNGLFLFKRNYMDYHSDRFLDHSLLIYKKNELIAVFPANENSNEIVSHGGLTYGSLIINSEIRTVEYLEIFNLLKEYYQSLNFINIRVKCIPSFLHKLPSQEDLYAMFLCNAHLYRRDISSVIDLKSNILYADMKSRSFKKCVKLGITVRESNTFENYWDLLERVLLKYDTKPVHSLSEIEYLKNLFPSEIRLFEAYDDEKLLAGVVLYDFGESLHTQYLANSDEGKKIGALDYINFNLIERFRNTKRYFSFGISTENQGRFLNEGLIQQKELMGGKAVTLDFYQINLNN